MFDIQDLKRLKYGLDPLIRPSAKLETNVQRQQARILASLSLALLLIVLIVTPIWVISAGTFAAARAISLALLLAVIAAYGLSRSRFYFAGAAVLILSLLGLVGITILTAPGSMYERMVVLNLLLVAIMISNLFLQRPFTLLLIGISLLAVAAFFFVPTVPFAFTLSYLVFFLLIIALGAISSILEQHYRQHLSESAALYRSVVAAMSEGIILQTQTGAIETCNAAAERILGLTAEQIIGRTSVDPRWQAIHEDGSPFPGETHPAMVTLRTGRPLSNIVMGVHQPDSSLHWIAINSQPLTRPGEALPLAVVTSFTNITERKQAEEALRQSEEHQRAMIAAIPDLIFLNHVDGTYLDYHAPDPSLLFVPPETLKGKKIAEIFPDRMAQEYMSLLQQTSNTGQLLEYAYELVIQEKIHHFEMRLVPVGADKVLSIARDVSELWQTRLELEAVQRRLEFAVEKARLAWWEMDVETGKVHFDPRKVTMIGYDPQEFENLAYQAFTDLVHPDDYAPMMQAMRDLLEGRKPFYTIDYRIQKADGDWIWFYDRGELLTTENGKQVVRGFVTDITEQKQFRQREIELVLEKERVQLLTTFLQNASHEFKTPLSVINATAFVMVHLLDPEKREMKLTVIQNQVQRMAMLINMLLVMTKLESSSEPTKDAIDIGMIVEIICQKILTRYEQHPTILYEKDLSLPPAMGNSDELSEALEQILDNACRFTPADGTVTVLTGAAEDQIWLEIHDTGPGIPAESLPHIFETFWRQDEAHSTPGFGLGLAIAKRAIERHKGKIEVESTIGMGSTFRVILPMH